MHKIIYLPDVVNKKIPKLTLPVRKRIRSAIAKKLAIDPVAFGKPLRYSLKGLRRLRVDDYRVVYKIDENNQNVIFVKIAHRKVLYE